MYLFIVTDGSGLHTTCFATFRFDALLLTSSACPTGI